jgi:light-regulated signal transduction histidine kinase (bacteriophytochrome)
MNPDTYDAETLVSCDSEEIHLMGAIQPTGFLLSISSDWIVLRASANAKTFLGLSGEIIGQQANTVLAADLLHDIRGRLQIAAGTGIVERLFGHRLATGLPRYDIAVHVSGGETILEFEASTGETSAPLSVLRSMMARTERQITVKKICDEAVRQIRALTQFDRVMVYRFDVDGAGEVVAESAISNLTPFLGLHYPASDIPPQAGLFTDAITSASSLMLTRCRWL